jgi:hypothetical protein
VILGIDHQDYAADVFIVGREGLGHRKLVDSVQE